MPQVLRHLRKGIGHCAVALLFLLCIIQLLRLGLWRLHYLPGLSLLALFVDKTAWPSLHEFVHVTFVLSVVALFITNVAIRLYYFPRAQVARFRDFVGHAYGKHLSHRTTTAYYNNAATTVPARIAAQVLESAFFTKHILSRMARQ